MKSYIVAYDILNPKRAVKIRKLIYSFSLGGQKSALETHFSRKDLNELLRLLKPILHDEDSVNIVEVDREPMIFGKSDCLKYDKGVVII